MIDIKFDCPSCRQSLEAPPDMAGQLIDCPSCKKTIEIPMPRPTPKVEKPPHTRPAPRPSPPPLQTCNAEPPSAAPANVLPKILSVLVLIAVMVGGFFGYNFWKDQQAAKIEAQKAEAKAKAEVPFFVAAREALDEAHKLESALGVGLNYQKYGDELILVAAKVDNLLRAVTETGIDNMKPEAKDLCAHLVSARESFKSARDWWELKIKYPDSEHTEEDRGMQDQWKAASDSLSKADAVFVRLRNE